MMGNEYTLRVRKGFPWVWREKMRGTYEMCHAASWSWFEQGYQVEVVKL